MVISDYERLREQHGRQFQDLLPRYVERISWPAARLRQERERRLRELLATAKESSPWHRERLKHIDPNRATEADLQSIPPMTKSDMMANFDGIVTDRRLSLEIVETHLASLGDDAYLLDEFHVAASGGSSGQRGVFVYGWQAWMVAFATLLRFRYRFQLSNPGIGMKTRATVAAGKATHMTFAMPRTFREMSNSTAIPATLPMAEIVGRLNALQPVILMGYPSMLYALAGEARAGRLNISPRMIGPNSEPLLPEIRATLESVWHCPLMNVYGTSEGVSAASCEIGQGMHLSEDIAIFEPVDMTGLPVPAGIRAAKMYVTNLYNPVQPLIRYELTDEVSLMNELCPCGSGMRRIGDIEGRTDDMFAYREGITVHPLVFRSVLGSERNIVEYQVRQTPDGADVSVRALGPIDLGALTAKLEQGLTNSGLAGARVSIGTVEALDRQQTGKFKRFIPLD